MRSSNQDAAQEGSAHELQAHQHCRKDWSICGILRCGQNMLRRLKDVFLVEDRRSSPDVFVLSDGLAC